MSNVRNFSKSTNFMFDTNLFSDEEVRYFVQEVNLPGLNMSHIGISKQAVNGYIQGDTITYNNLSLSLILDEDMTVWKNIISNIMKMRDNLDNTGEEYSKNGFLTIYDANKKVVVKLKFVNMMLGSIGDVNYNTNVSDTETLVCSIDISYDYYEVVK